MRVLVDTALPNHRKIGRLMDQLGVSRREAIGTVVTLWCKVMSESEDGSLKGWTLSEIGRAAGAPEDRLEETAKALRSCGFIDGQAVHEWVEHQGDLKAKRKAWKDRQKKHRLRPSPSVPYPTVPNHVHTRDSRVSHAVVTRDKRPAMQAVNGAGSRCGTCGDTGLTPAGVVNGKISLGPCSCGRKAKNA